MNVSKYNKFIVAIGTAVATTVSFAADGEISQNDLIGIVLSLLGALGVYSVKNANKGSSWNFNDNQEGN